MSSESRSLTLRAWLETLATACILVLITNWTTIQANQTKNNQLQLRDQATSNIQLRDQATSNISANQDIGTSILTVTLQVGIPIATVLTLAVQIQRIAELLSDDLKVKNKDLQTKNETLVDVVLVLSQESKILGSLLEKIAEASPEIKKAFIEAKLYEKIENLYLRAKEIDNMISIEREAGRWLTKRKNSLIKLGLKTAKGERKLVKEDEMRVFEDLERCLEVVIRCIKAGIPINKLNFKKSDLLKSQKKDFCTDAIEYINTEIEEQKNQGELTNNVAEMIQTSLNSLLKKLRD
ncbi:hypothetical protein ACN4EK_14010 [Pantanalinema rosaneae CENA516]|uniref:hypothetical protein n=1 Tax=Pantanalinema rosaneae TaxID=1620701 RepID=UPI003D6EC2E5